MNKVSIVSFLLLIAITACRPSKTVPTQAASYPTVETPSIIGDGGLISGLPCASPCFFGIHVQETSFDQAISILETNGIHPCDREGINIFCKSNSDTANVVLVANRSSFLVEGISYDPSVLILVKDIIAKYGNPSSVNLVLDNTGGNPSSPQLLMSLFWDSIKIGGNLAVIPAKEDQVYIVESTTEVQWISLGEGRYFAPSQPWKGYGAYKP